MSNTKDLTLAGLSAPAKALATCVIFTLAMGMLGAMAQIIVHDVVPTFFSNGDSHQMEAPPQAGTMPMGKSMDSDSKRGDLFGEMDSDHDMIMQEEEPAFDQEQLVWTLRWTHIHLFGINMIFILMAGITLLLDVSNRLKTWLIVLPFAGILIDISAMWLKSFVSPVFFWLHVPGGSTFFSIFAFVSLRALWELWLTPQQE